MRLLPGSASPPFFSDPLLSVPTLPAPPIPFRHHPLPRLGDSTPCTWRGQVRPTLRQVHWGTVRLLNRTRVGREPWVADFGFLSQRKAASQREKHREPCSGSITARRQSGKQEKTVTLPVGKSPELRSHLFQRTGRFKGRMRGEWGSREKFRGAGQCECCQASGVLASSCVSPGPIAPRGLGDRPCLRGGSGP